MKKVRIFFLRLLLAWWFIAFLTIMVLPIFTLVAGLEESVKVYKDLVSVIWNGV